MRLCEVKYVYVEIVFTCSTLHLFPYPVPAGGQGSVQHFTLKVIPVDVLVNMFTLFSTVKELKCEYICSPQKVQCVHMYSVDWDALVFCTNHYFTPFTWTLLNWVEPSFTPLRCGILIL